MKYRNDGARGALLDEYERALKTLIDVIEDLSQAQLIAVVDVETKNEDCRSIQTVLTHVLRAGYWYIHEIRKHQGEDNTFVAPIHLPRVLDYQKALWQLLEANVSVFEQYPNMPLETYNQSDKMLVKWGQTYDVEQLMEHAIVHILRHRRQIERFLIRLE